MHLAGIGTFAWSVLPLRYHSYVNQISIGIQMGMHFSIFKFYFFVRQILESLSLICLWCYIEDVTVTIPLRKECLQWKFTTFLLFEASVAVLMKLATATGGKSWVSWSYLILPHIHIKSTAIWQISRLDAERWWASKLHGTHINPTRPTNLDRILVEQGIRERHQNPTLCGPFYNV